MPAETHNPEDSIIVLPWNRLPNYLICAVALVNLVGGIIALSIAAGFAKDISSFNDAVATVFTGLFGLLFVWVAWCFRTGVLPVRFVADAARRECGFRWGRWWNGRFDLSGADKLIGELRKSRDRWSWAVLIPAADQEMSSRWIYGASKPLGSAQAAEQECREVIARLGDHLQLPFEIRNVE